MGRRAGLQIELPADDRAGVAGKIDDVASSGRGRPPAEARP